MEENQLMNALKELCNLLTLKNPEVSHEYLKRRLTIFKN